MSNIGIGRARMFFGGVLLSAAAITWATGFLMSPHSQPIAEGTEHVRTTIVLFLRHSAIATLILTAIATWLLFPMRRPRRPLRDQLLMAIIAVMAFTSIYQLIWLRTA